MKNALLLIIILCFAYLQVSSQKKFSIDSLSKGDIIKLRNFHKERWINSVESYRDTEIEMFVETSDSLVIEKRNCIPMALINVTNISNDEIIFELPAFSEYSAIDTLYKSVSKKRIFSKQTTTKSTEFFPNNSLKLNDLPQSIEVKINGIFYRGDLIRIPKISIINADGKNFSIDELIYGVEAIYVVQIDAE